MIRLLLDQGLPLRAAADLREEGHDARHVREDGLQRETDSALLEFAAAQGRVVVTLDADFSRLMALGGRASPSIVHVRLKRLPRAESVALLRGLVVDLQQQLTAGCIVTVTDAGLRVRKLPIRRPGSG